jgi:hypothetical protein
MPTIVGECVTKSVVTERVLRSAPDVTQIGNTNLGKVGVVGPRVAMSAKKATGIRVPAANATPTHRIMLLPLWAPATPVTHIAAIRVKVVNRRLVARSGDAFQTRIAKPIRTTATPNSGVEIIGYSS